MTDVVIVDALRTPIGALGGALYPACARMTWQRWC